MLRYVLTFVNSKGLRVMAHDNDGRSTFLEKKDVYHYLRLLYKNNNIDKIRSIFGDKPKFKATQTACYSATFESCRTVFEN